MLHGVSVCVCCSCPVSRNSQWYWTPVDPAPQDLFVVQTGLVPAFKLYSSNVVYLHCNLRLCLVGEKCPLKAKVNNIRFETCSEKMRRCRR